MTVKLINALQCCQPHSINLITKMKAAIIVCTLAIAGLALARPNDGYTTKFDNINLDQIIGNPRMMLPYIKCMLDQGRCTAEGKELKNHLREALETDCAKCSDAQRKGADKVIRHLINNEPEAWKQLKAKYDPKGIYEKKHAAELRNAKA